MVGIEEDRGLGFCQVIISSHSNGRRMVHVFFSFLERVVVIGVGLGTGEEQQVEA